MVSTLRLLFGGVVPVRVLFSSTWGYGHVFPMVPLAQACLAAGHDVLWAGNEPAGPLVEAAGIRFAAAGLSAQGVREVTSRNAGHVRHLPPEDRAAFAFPHMFGAWATPAMSAQLLPLARDWRPDLLVHEAAELASPLVGAVLGVPTVTHSFGTPVPAASLTETADRLEFLWSEHALVQPSYAGCFGAGYLDIFPASLQPIYPAHISSRTSLRPVPWTGRPVVELAPYLQRAGRPLIYLTFGTVSNHAAVLRPAVEALSALPLRVLVAVGPDGDPDLLGLQPSNVTIERWVPQAQVLQRCDAVISHAGSGTFLGGLAAGLPQLCLPQAADQFRNTAAGTQRGAALALAPDVATGEAIASAVMRLLCEPSFRTAAEEVAIEIADMPSPAEVVNVLTQIAAKPRALPVGQSSCDTPASTKAIPSPAGG